MSNGYYMNGRYLKTAWNDVKSSPGWFKNVVLLGLLSFIPVFGSMCVYGYSFEWAHKAAWGMKTPMPDRIFGRPGSKMLRWGWFALVITVVLCIVPYILYSIGGGIEQRQTADLLREFRYGSFNSMYHPGGGALASFLTLVAAVLLLVAFVWSIAAIMRMTIYDRLGTGLQFSQVCKMVKHDLGGLMRILGMSLWIACVIVLVVGIVIGVVIVAVIAGNAISAIGMYGSASVGDYTRLLVGMVVSLMPFFLVMAFVANVASALLQLLVARAAGYWTAQFNVPGWGQPDDPLPFERTGQAPPVVPQSPMADGYGQPQQTAQPQAGMYGQPYQAAQQPIAPQPEQPPAAPQQPEQPQPEQQQPEQQVVQPQQQPVAPSEEPGSPRQSLHPGSIGAAIERGEFDI